ncbi:hypothetical protein Trydic_g16461 [Trypoxylus dichotomus]
MYPVQVLRSSLALPYGQTTNVSPTYLHQTLDLSTVVSTSRLSKRATKRLATRGLNDLSIATPFVCLYKPLSHSKQVVVRQCLKSCVISGDQNSSRKLKSAQNYKKYPNLPKFPRARSDYKRRNSSDFLQTSVNL